ncbi:MAG: radical SAM protein [Sulfolobales archaeon]
MIPVSVLVSGRGTVSFKIKGAHDVDTPPNFSSELRPIIAWNITRACNLKCLHCYIDAGAPSPYELSTEEALNVVDQIRDIGSPLIIFSGGEPLLRRDLFTLASRAAGYGIKLVLSTNGVLIDKMMARKILDTGFQYVGVSIDSYNPEWHDSFRGVRGSFKAAVEGIRNLVDLGVGVGIRYTITRYNISEAPGVIEFAASIGARRVTFYHLSYVGRALKLPRDWIPLPEQYKIFMDKVIELAEKYSGVIEIETTLGPFDGVYIAIKKARDSVEMKRLLEFVKRSGGCGRKIISIFPDGSVKPCQFVDFIDLGNVRKEHLSSIIRNLEKEPYRVFIEPWKYVRRGKCAQCQFLQYCGGGDRVRAYHLEGSLDASDPYCPIPAFTSRI